jgi:hypothetical protein
MSEGREPGIPASSERGRRGPAAQPPRAGRTTGISRRRFITGLGVATGAAVAAGYGLTVWQSGSSSSRAHRSAPAPTAGTLGGRSDHTLVVVELGGGNDGLNTVVPMTDPAYRTLRPTLGVTDAVALDDSVGLDPRLAKLADRYKAGHVAIVEGVGYPDPNLSHFASLGYWWTGTPGDAGGAGWLGRYLDGTVGFEDPLAAIGIARCHRRRCSATSRSRPRSPTPPASSRRCPRGWSRATT